jgi:integrase
MPMEPRRRADPVAPCLTDATHLRGFAALRRRHPRTWARRMRDAGRAVGPDATVAELMRTGAMGRLLPRAADGSEAGRLKKLRHCARCLVRAYGDLQVGDITEAWLRRHRPRAGLHMGVGRDVAGAAFTLLRQATFAAQRQRGEVRVRPRLGPRRRAAMGPPPDRPTAPWPTLEVLVERAGLRTRAITALQMHVGASCGQVLALRVRDVDLAQGVVWCTPRGGGARLPYALPSDAVRAIVPWRRRRARLGPDALLFPQRGAPRRPTRSVNRALGREARRLGLEPTTLAAIRRFAQAGLRGVDAVRAQVRGSAASPTRGRGIDAGELDRQRRAWTWQLGAEERRVPLRAPRRCRADEPERKRRWRPRWRPDAAYPPTPLDRRSPWARVRPHRSADTPTRRPPPRPDQEPTSAALPRFTPLPQASIHHISWQEVRAPSSPEDLVTVGLLGATAGGIAGLLAPRVVEGALEVAAEAVLSLARDLHAAGDEP